MRVSAVTVTVRLGARYGHGLRNLLQLTQRRRRCFFAVCEAA